ncbi:MAG: VWA domain-containing protein [Candidatus Methanogranum gryphiswaldense]|nr:MAG: VWA domain-containing protein [Candidatus Methanogranum sp. U3.2.1]
MPAEPLTCIYPISAIVGMENAKIALECALINPSIHSVLLRGSEGTAKSTTARAIAGITSKKVITCPLGISEEQLFGGLDLEKAMRTGKTESDAGLLTKANENILYIDDVNLMEKTTLASIFDVVLTGMAKVERGPISRTYSCNTILIATMNPEGSDLDPHMLDRFDLCSYIEPTDEICRKEILNRNIDFCNDPIAFSKLYKKEENETIAKIRRAEQILPTVTISDEIILIISELCIRLGADGCRGDISMVNCARTLAAMNGRDEVIRKDVEAAAILCLAHRRNNNPPPPPKQQTPENQKNDQNELPSEHNQKEDQNSPEPPQIEKDDHNNESVEPEEQELPDIDDIMFEIGKQFRVIDYLDSYERLPSRTKTRKGRRAIAESGDGTGRYARSRIPFGQSKDIAFDATILAAAPYQRTRESNGLSIVINKQDLREKVRERRSGCTLIFLVDASGSLGVKRRMATVKGAILSMLRESYVKRDRIGLIAFRRDSADVILPPTRSVEYSYKKLEELPTGGKTPLGEALNKVDDYMNSYARCHTGERCFVILVTDGRANVPLKEGTDANDEVQRIAKKIKIPGIRWIVVDAGISYPHFDNAERLAENLNARYFRLEDLDADRFAKNIKSAIDS